MSRFLFSPYRASFCCSWEPPICQVTTPVVVLGISPQQCQEVPRCRHGHPHQRTFRYSMKSDGHSNWKDREILVLNGWSLWISYCTEYCMRMSWFEFWPWHRVLGWVVVHPRGTSWCVCSPHCSGILLHQWCEHCDPKFESQKAKPERSVINKNMGTSSYKLNPSAKTKLRKKHKKHTPSTFGLTFPSSPGW